MLKLEAPYPAPVTTTLLPNPEFNDSEALTHSMKLKRSINGTLYTTVHTTTNRHKLTYTVVVSEAKADELKAFITSYSGVKIRLTDHNKDVWLVNFVSNPIPFETSAPAGNWPGGEVTSVTFECEGIKV